MRSRQVRLAAGVLMLLASVWPATAGESKPVVDWASPAALDAEFEAGRLPEDFAGTEGIASGSSVRAVMRSLESASISAELSARITYLPRREGDRIAKGEPLVKFDCAKLEAELAAADATYQSLRIAHEAEAKLEEYAAAGRLAVDRARYEMLRAEAERGVLEVKRAGCTIVAPFDGIVTEKVAQLFEIAQPNQPILKFVNASSLEMVMMVPSSWLPRMIAGTPFVLHVDELGRSFPARVVQSTGMIDPVSQSGRLIGEFTLPVRGVLPGMSGTAAFEMEALGQ